MYVEFHQVVAAAAGAANRRSSKGETTAGKHATMARAQHGNATSTSYGWADDRRKGRKGFTSCHVMSFLGHVIIVHPSTKGNVFILDSGLFVIFHLFRPFLYCGEREGGLVLSALPFGFPLLLLPLSHPPCLTHLPLLPVYYLQSSVFFRTRLPTYVCTISARVLCSPHP